MESKNRMKMISGIIFAIVIVAFGVVMFRSSREPVKIGPEAALPAFDEKSDHFVAKIGDAPAVDRLVRSLGSGLDLWNALRALGEAAGSAAGVDVPEVDKSIISAFDQGIGLVGKVTGAAEEMAIFASPTAEPVIAFTTTVERSDAMIKELGAQKDKDADRWSFDVMIASVRMARRVSDKRALCVISMSDAGLDAALAAQDDVAKRAKIASRTTKSSFLKLFASSSSGPVDLEFAWQTAKDETRLEMSNGAPSSKLKTSGFEGDPVRLYGKDEPLVFFSVDVPFAASRALPDASDPVEEALEMAEDQMGPIPDEFRDQVLDMLRTARVSGAVSMKKDSIIPSTAYALIETKDTSSLDQYFTFGEMMMQKADIKGWDKALAADLGAFVGMDSLNVVVAKSGTKVLVGLGSPDEYASTAGRPAAMASLPEKGVVGATFINIAALLDKDTELGKTLRQELEDDPETKAIVPLLDDISVRAIAGVTLSNEGSEALIQWKK